MSPTNSAAWLLDPNRTPFTVRSAPYPTPKAGQIVVRNRATAINPEDWMKQHMGSFLYGWMKYPLLMGSDIAGEVVEVGPKVVRFSVGDRVMGHAVAVDKGRNDQSEGGFQLYVVLLENMASQIPTTMSFESACVIPLGLSTAACSLFQKDQLALSLPTAATTPGSKNQSLIIWGGSTSVGCNAIQLAVAAGYTVITTCSPRNFDYVKHLGAKQAFDYNSATVRSDIVKTLKGKQVVGALTIGAGAIDACMDILPQCEGKNKFVSMATFPLPNPLPDTLLTPKIMMQFIPAQVSLGIKSRVRGIRTKFIFGTTLIENGVGKAIYEDYLPAALESGRFVPAPEPMVVGKGLESVQAACDVQRKGVSAKKVVITL